MENNVLSSETMSSIVDALATSNGINLSLIPRYPVITFYDNNDNKIYEAHAEHEFCAVRLMIECNNYIGYYCTIETEWWDDNNEYQGSNGKRNYQKFYFNDNGTHWMSDWPYNGPHQFAYNVLNKILKLNNM